MELHSPQRARETAFSLRLGDRQAEALETLERAISAWPDHASLLAERALLRLDRGESESAREDTARALEIDADCALALLARAHLRASEDLPGAIADAARAAQVDPGSASAWHASARFRAASGDDRGRREDLERASACDRSDPRSLYHQALARLDLGDAAGALEALDRAVPEGSRSPSLHEQRALALIRLGRFTEALAAHDLAVEAAPGQAIRHRRRGRARLLAGDLAGAFEDLTRATELDPDDVIARTLRSQAWTDPMGARADHERASRMGARDSQEYYYRSLAQEALGRRVEAGRDLARALELAPPPELRREIEARLQERTRRTFPGTLLHHPASALLLGTCIAVWLLQGPPFVDPSADTLLERGALERRQVSSGEYWRLLTSVFLHIGLVHLAWNVWCGWGLTREVERRLGSVRTILVFLLTGVAGSAASVLGATLLGRDVVSAGSSGALFGMIGFLFRTWREELGGWAEFLEDPAIRRNLGLVGLWFLLGLTILPMDNFAHAGGMLLGWALARAPGARRSLDSTY